MTSTYDAGINQRCQNDTPSKVSLIIHHQFPGVELVSPICIGDGITCYLSPDQSVDVDSTAKASFSIDPVQEESIGILIYKLQRKNINQSNEGVIHNEEEATCIQLVIVWKVTSSKRFHVFSWLIEHDKDRVWNRDGLLKLAERYTLINIRRIPIEYTYLMHDNTVLMTRVNVTREECYRLEITLSETSIKDDTQRLHYIDSDM
jgi:hypothetical protein